MTSSPPEDPHQPEDPQQSKDPQHGAPEPANESTHHTRRRFLTFLAGGAAGAAGAGAIYAQNSSPSTTSGPGRTGQASPSGTEAPGSTSGAPAAPNTLPASPASTLPTFSGPLRTLVVIELNGGNDGLATLVPYSNDRLAALRPTLMPKPEAIIAIDDDFGITTSLKQNWEQGLALVQGIGIPGGSGSHFEMERRWWSGTSTGSDLATTGFLGRLCDELDQGQPITGLSLGTRRSPAMLSAKPVTAGLTNPSVSWWVNQQNAWFSNLRTGIAGLSNASSADSPTVSVAREGLGSALDFAGVLSNVDVKDITARYPKTALGWQFAIAAEVISADAGVRVIHVTHGNFDTHDSQSGTHEHLLGRLDEALAYFRADLAEKGRTDDVLIATTSEFGRRPQQSGTGTDHGSASMALLAGPVNNGRFGEHPSLKNLDENDNLVPTFTMDEYYATIAEGWLGVPASTLLTNAPPVVPGLLAT